MFDELLARAPYSIPAAEKSAMMLPALAELTNFHAAACPAYARILDAAWGGQRDWARIEDIPYLPVGLFKEMELSSTTARAITLRSSGTTGQTPSRIAVDDETATRQSKALVACFRPILGPRRLPFLAIDSKSVLTDGSMTARGAGVLGMMKFGGKTVFALDAGLSPNRDAIRRFVAQNGSAPFLIFGFTFLVWTALYSAFDDGELDLSNAVLIHSGGWKKLEAEKVSNAVFRAALARRFGITRIHNFYGFVEQIGSVFLEGDDGLLYPPNFTDVIIRRPGSWAPAPVGEEGLIQTVSLLPRSYPGHSVLTEDLGTVVSVDAGVGGRLGKALRISGRVPRAELRGCSDVIAVAGAT